MTAERCPTCDQTGGTYKESASGPPTPVCSYECLSNAVDWRARALAAEEKADACQRDWYGAKAEFGAARARLRADAARAERERVVAYAIECAGRCNTLSERHLFLAFADALNDGDHAKGGR